MICRTGCSNKNIIIIPDEELNLLPFEALTSQPYDSNNQKVSYNKLQYLLLDYNISYLYSSYFLLNLNSLGENPVLFLKNFVKCDASV